MQRDLAKRRTMSDDDFSGIVEGMNEVLAHGRPDIVPITPEAGGSILFAAGVQHITLTVTGPLAPGATGVTLTRAEAEAVAKALGVALARLRTAEARPKGAEAA